MSMVFDMARGAVRKIDLPVPALPNEPAGRDRLDTGNDAVAMEHHFILQIRDHTGVVGNDPQDIADLWPGAGAVRQVHRSMFFGQAYDFCLGIIDHQAEIGKAQQIRRQPF